MFTGYDIFGSEKEIRGHLKSMEFEYECGNFESSTGKDVSFVRVADVYDVVKKSINGLNESGFFVEKSNIPKNLLWVLLTGDKGGKSTKLLLQFLNCKEQHSIQTARLLAIFEGDKDNYQCIQKVFGPVIEETKKVLLNITELDPLRWTLQKAQVQVSSLILKSEGVNQFHNCESTPVYQATGSVIDSVSCMPLHLSLGLGKQALELVESEAISLDNTIKEANGEASPELVEAFQKREELILDCANLE